MTEISEVDQDAIVVNGKSYSLAVAPDYQDDYVQAQVHQILGQLSLDDVTENLDLAVELFFVAYHGVAAAKDGSVRAEIAELQSKLAVLCNSSVVTMTAFESETGNIIKQLLGTYKWLTHTQEKLALKTLSHCAESSATMATAAKQLATEFMELQVSSTKARSKTITEETDEQNRKEAAEKAAREMQAQQKAEATNQAELVAQISDMQQRYNEAKAAEEKESTKALVLGITTAITGAIGAGLAAFAASQNPVGTLVSGAANAQGRAQSQAQTAAAQKDVADAQQKSQAAQSALLTAKDTKAAAKLKVDQLQTTVDDLNKKIATAEQDSNTKQADLEQLKTDRDAKQVLLTTAKKDLAAADDKVKTLETDAATTTAAYAAAGKALESLAQSTGQMAASAATAEEAIHAEKMKYLDSKLELEKQKRASLVALTTYAEGIKNFQAEEGSATLAVNSMHAAVDALGKIIATLTNASLFWEQMAAYCNRMTTQGFQQTITDLTDPAVGLTPDERLEEYRSQSFMGEYLGYLVQWVAVNGLSGTYVVSAAAAQKKAVAYLGQSPTIEEAIKKAPELAKNLSFLIDKGLSESRQVSIELEQQKALMAAR